MNQEAFYKFRKKCTRGVIVNEKYNVTISEVEDAIDNIVVNLKKINEDCWEVTLEEKIIDDTNILYIKRI